MAEMMTLNLQVYGKRSNVERFYKILIADTEWMNPKPEQDPEYILIDGISWANLRIIDGEYGNTCIGIIEGETKYSVREWYYNTNKVYASKNNKVCMSFDVLTKLLDLDVIIDGICPGCDEETSARICKGVIYRFDITDIEADDEDCESE